MESKFTPRPWRFEPTKSSDVFNVGHIFCSRGGFVATVHHPIAPVSYSLSESRANARLIAAAPDLLAALIRLEHVESGPHSETTRYLAREDARAAIAKALGKE